MLYFYALSEGSLSTDRLLSNASDTGIDNWRMFLLNRLISDTIFGFSNVVVSFGVSFIRHKDFIHTQITQ